MYKRLMIIAILLGLISVSSVFIGTTIINHQSWNDIKNDFYHSKTELMDYYINQTINDLESLLYANAVWSDLQEKIDDNDYEWMYDNASGYIVDDESFDIDYILVTNEDLSFMDQHGDDITDAIQRSNAFKEALMENVQSNEIIWINGTPMIIVSSPTKDNNYINPYGTYTLGRWLNKERLEELKTILGGDIVKKISLDHKNDYDSILTDNYSSIQLSHKISLDNSLDYFNVQVITPVFHDAFVTKKNHAIVVIMGISTLCVIIAMFFYRKMMVSIVKVIEAVKRISNGEYEARANTTGMKEVDQLADAVNKMAVDITYQLKEIDINYLSMIEIMANAIEVIDAYTSEHNNRVADISAMIGEYINFPDIEALKIAARLHDIGKISIPSEVLNKHGKLSPEEFEIIKTHPVAGFQIMDKIEYFKEIKYGVLYHHERYDGKGYPHGLVGDEIPLLAQIISIADVFDALITDRPYRKAFSIEKAVEVIIEGSGTMFNPILVEAFLKQFNQMAKNYVFSSDYY